MRSKMDSGFCSASCRSDFDKFQNVYSAFSEVNAMKKERKIRTRLRVAVIGTYFPGYRNAVFARLSSNPAQEFTFLAGLSPSKSFIRDATARPYTFFPIRWFAIPIPGTRNFISYRCGTIWALLQRKYDVLIMTNDVLGLDIWICCVLSRLLRVPVIIWGQGISRPPSRFRDILRFILTTLASAAVYYSEGGRDYWVKQGIPSKKIFVAYNALDTDKQIQIRDTTTQEDIAGFLRTHGLVDKRLVAYLGRLIPVKKPSVFIDAVAKAHAQDSRVVGVLIGDGPQRKELEQQARNQNLLGNVVRFVGESYDEHVLAKYLMASSAVVLPAAAGLAIQQAAVYGAPLILGDIPNEHLPEQEIVKEGKTGLWCPDEDVDAFTSAILRLASDPAYRKLFSVNLKREIDEKYNVARMAQGFIDAVHFCMGE